MEAAQARQKSYADKRRKPIEFEVGDYIYLKVSPMKGVQRFGVKRKLAPRYVGPYPIIEKSGRVAYKIELPYEMRAIFNGFHVSQLKKCLHVLEERVFYYFDFRAWVEARIKGVEMKNVLRGINN